MLHESFILPWIRFASNVFVCIDIRIGSDFAKDEVNKPLSKFISCIMFYVSPQYTRQKKIEEDREKKEKKNWSSNQSTTTIHDPNNVRFHFKLKAWSDWTNHKGKNSVHKSVANVEIKWKKRVLGCCVKCAKLKCGFDWNLSIFPVLILF